MLSIDLNCDLGESYGVYRIGNDAEIMKFITSANIACGFHAGDPTVMYETVKLACKHTVKIGAHPGFQDLIGFGRRNLQLSSDEVFTMVLYQIGALESMVRANGAKLNHVKPHGALYNMCAVNSSLADAVAKAIYHFDKTLILYGLANSELITAGRKYNLQTAQEVFADRTYQPDGTLTPRVRKDALIKNDLQALHQTLQMVIEKKVTTVTGEMIPITAETICIHGDGENAVTFAEKIKKGLEENGVTVK